MTIDKEAKLNQLLKTHGGKLDTEILTKNFKVENGSLAKQKPQTESNNSKNGPRNEMQLMGSPPFFKPNLDIKKADQTKIKAQIQPVYRENKKVRNLSVPTVKMEHKKLNKQYTPASQQVQDGLQAADKGIPNTLNKSLALMSSRYINPSIYRSMGQVRTLEPSGYRAAAMINAMKEQELQQLGRTLQTEPVAIDELKQKRNQITVAFNYFLKRYGNNKLKEELAKLAETLTYGQYPYVRDQVSRSLPDRVDTMPIDMEAMEALVTALNSTNKAIFISDQIYINAMLTMYLNEYNRKNIRSTTFLLAPFTEETNFTDSESMFTANQYYEKIRDLSRFSFAGVDCVYLDLTLMREMAYQILCQIIMALIERQIGNISMCQIVVRTQLDLGNNEEEFFMNMGVKIFEEIFSYLTDDRGIGVNMAFNALTGKTRFMEGLNMSKVRAAQSSNVPSAQAIAVTSEKDEMDKYKKELEDEINEEATIIANLDNAIQQAVNTGAVPRSLMEEADRHEIARNVLLNKLNRILIEENKTPIKDTFKRKQVDESPRKQLLKAEADKLKKEAEDREKAAAKALKEEEDRIKAHRDAEAKKEETNTAAKLKPEFLKSIKHIIKTIENVITSLATSTTKTPLTNTIITELERIVTVTEDDFVKYIYTVDYDDLAKTFKIDTTLNGTVDFTPTFIKNFFERLMKIFDDIKPIAESEKDIKLLKNIDDIQEVIENSQTMFSSRTVKFKDESETNVNKLVQQKRKEEEEKRRNKEKEEYKNRLLETTPVNRLKELKTSLVDQLSKTQLSKRTVGYYNANQLQIQLLSVINNEDIYKTKTVFSYKSHEVGLDGAAVVKHGGIQFIITKKGGYNFKDTYDTLLEAFNRSIKLCQRSPWYFVQSLEKMVTEIKESQSNLVKELDRINIEGKGVHFDKPNNLSIIRGGAGKYRDTNFLDEIHQFVYIKKINKFNKSTYIISI